MAKRRRSSLPNLDRRRHHERASLGRLMLSHEHSLEMHLTKVLAGLGRRAAHGFVLDGRDGAVEALDNTRGEINRVLRPSLVVTARAFADRLMSHPKCAHHFEVKAAFGDLDRALLDFLDAHSAQAVVGISASTRTAILNAIRRGQEENLDTEELARMIVEVTHGEIGRARARRIARTETHAAAMFGQQAAAEASGVPFVKEWLATEDARTRKDHAEANGQRVALNEPFVVGGHELLYPGDTSAPPGQIINCRCVALYEPDR